MDFNLFDCKESHSTFGIYEENRHEKLTDKLRIDFLELPKAIKYKTNDKLQEWLDFLNITTEEGLNMIETKTANPLIQKAVTIVRQMSADEKFLMDIQKREETLMNERSALYVAKQEGLQEGITKGKQEALEKNIATLRSLGINVTDEMIEKMKENL